MRAFLYIDTHGYITTYTEQLLRHLLRQSGIETTYVSDDADLLLVSMGDCSDVKLLKRARKESRGRPIIAGGFEGYCATPYMGLADAFVTGEGFSFFDALSESLPSAISAQNVYTPGKMRIVPDHNVPWKDLPLVQTGPRAAYWLSGRGCHRKCTFCMASHVSADHRAPKYISEEVSRFSKHNGLRLTMISNDSAGSTINIDSNSSSVTANQYLRDPSRFLCKSLHIGIEGWTESERHSFGKPISNAEITEIIRITGEKNQQVFLYFIVGRRGWSLDTVRDFCENCIPVGIRMTPKVFCKMTYFCPCPHTPMAKEPCSTEFCDTGAIWNIFAAKNRRFHVMPTRSLARSAWRSIIRRCNPENLARLGIEPRDNNKPESLEKFMTKLEKRGLLWLFGKIDFDPCSEIITQYEMSPSKTTHTKMDRPSPSEGYRNTGG